LRGPLNNRLLTLERGQVSSSWEGKCPAFAESGERPDWSRSIEHLAAAAAAERHRSDPPGICMRHPRPGVTVGHSPPPSDISLQTSALLPKNYHRGQLHVSELFSRMTARSGVIRTCSLHHHVLRLPNPPLLYSSHCHPRRLNAAADFALGLQFNVRVTLLKRNE